MTAMNANTRWARTFVDELVSQGVSTACLTPGSRSTPLTLAFNRHADIDVISLLDERSAAFFALGRAKRTGEPTPLVCTSGTAAANFHPAVIEADHARVPMVVLTADRPPELQDSGANQTIDQHELYGSAVRWERTLPEPEATPRKLRMLRTTAARAVSVSTGTPAGPVHLNFPFRKPLEPSTSPEEPPDDLDHRDPEAARGRDGPFVRVARGQAALAATRIEEVATTVAEAERGLISAGPADLHAPSADAVAELASATGFPIVADPLSGVRFGDHVGDVPVLGGYDSYLDPALTSDWPDSDVVIRFGASPTSKTLREYLERTRPRQFLVDPAGEWREATFAVTDLIAADPELFASALAERVDRSQTHWCDRLTDVERHYWDLVDAYETPDEGDIVRVAVENAPEPSTVFVSNSTPVRDMDQFVPPSPTDLCTLANRGASGIDGITSTAFGAGSALGKEDADESLVLVTGDLAFYHDMNGLLALSRCDVEATIIVIDNDGGGIFHRLPIADHDAFETQFVTPHGLDFEPTAELYNLGFHRLEGSGDLEPVYRDALRSQGSQVIVVPTDAAASQRARETIHSRVTEELA